MVDHKLVTQINQLVRKFIDQGWSAEALKEYKFELLGTSETKARERQQANAKPKQQAQSQQKAAAVAAEGNTRRPPPPPPPPADSIAAKEKEENTEWCPPCPPPAELPPGKEVSVPETTSSQPREVPTTSVQDDEWRTSEDPEHPPVKRFKGSGKNGSNGIPLVDGGASEDLLNNPKETQNIIPEPLPAYSKKRCLGMVQRWDIHQAPRRLLEERRSAERPTRGLGRPQTGQKWWRVDKNNLLPRGGVRGGRQRGGICKMRCTSTPQTGAQSVHEARCQRRVRVCSWWQMLLILDNFQRCIG